MSEAGWPALLGRRAFHPFAFALYPVLFLTGRNPADVVLEDLLAVAAGALLLALLLWAAARLGFGDGHRAAILASVVLVVFFSYGHLYRFLGATLPAVARHRFLLPLAALLLAATVVLLRSKRAPLPVATRGLNAVALALLALAVLDFRVLLAAGSGSGRSAVEVAPPAELPGSRPDVFFVVLDGFASDEVLRREFGETTTLGPELEALGFQVDPGARSNYSLTYLSLASTLEMRYLDELKDHSSIEGAALATRRLIRNSAVARTFRRLGYRLVHYSSGWAATEKAPLATEPVRCDYSNDLLLALIPTTLLNPVKAYAKLIGYRERIQCALQGLQGFTSPDQPVFVFAHVMAPHPPFVFDAEGRFTTAGDLTLTGWHPREAYLAQVRYVSRELLAVGRHLTSPGGRRAIVIFQGDHGPASSFSDDSWPRPSERNLQEVFGILNAMRFPEGGPRPERPPSPVNTFRYVFSEYFGIDLPPLEERRIFVAETRPPRPILRDVTGRLE